ncbi:MAG: hypothetical protein ABI629_18070 [bacterium]
MACVHDPLPFGSLCTDDANECTLDVCQPGPDGPACNHSPLTYGSACDDRSPCTQYDACNGVGACIGSAPVLDCRSAGKANLAIKNAGDDGGDLVAYSWRRGAATDESELGDPTTTTNYTLCVFDGSGRLQMSASVPAGGQCGDAACWKRKAKGYAYKDDLKPSAGIRKVRLRPGEAERFAGSVRGNGANLTVPVLPLTPPLLVQVINDDTGVCFKSDFDSPSRNTAKILQASTP